VHAWNQILTELERVAVQLDQTTPSDLETLDRLLGQRDLAVGHLRRLVEASADPLSLDSLHRLEAIVAGGVRLRDKLLLAKAEMRQQLAGLYQGTVLLQTLSAGSAREPENLDCLV